MSRKINSTSLKLAKIQLWTISAQKYGNSFSIFFLNFKLYYYLLLFTNFLRKKDHFSLDFIKCYTKFNQLFIIIYLQGEKDIFTNYAKALSKYLKKLNYTCVIQLYSKELIFTSSFISAYFQKLLKLNLAPKKALTTLTAILIKNIGFKKCVQSKYGTQYLVFKGFRLQISGRLENSKIPMTQTIEQTHGTLPLISLVNYVEYSNFFIFSKLGTCNFKVWIFYETITKT